MVIKHESIQQYDPDTGDETYRWCAMQETQIEILKCNVKTGEYVVVGYEDSYFRELCDRLHDLSEQDDNYRYEIRVVGK